MQVCDEGVFYCNAFRFLISCMTAIVVVYTPEGFVMASDGCVRWAGAPPDDPPLSRDAQKVFPINEQMGFAFAGYGRNRDGSFSTADECKRQAAALVPDAFQGAYEYVDAFSRNLKNVFEDARRTGLIEGFDERRDAPRADRFTILEIFIAGFFGGEPFWIDAKLRHKNQTSVVHELSSVRLAPGQSETFGSAQIPRLIQNGDRRFAAYRPHFVADIASLRSGIDYARAYIEACSDPVAASIDPLCLGIGGRIQIATIRSKQGFQWVPGFEAVGLP
jgi:hypothetical protein